MGTHKIKLREEQEQLIERLGILTEKNGMPPAAARILSLLLVADVTELTFEQIQETLGLSKSAVSNAINLLLNTDQIDYVTRLGDRKRYFRNKVISWKDNLKHSILKFEEMTKILEEVLVQRPGNTTEFNSQLKEIIDFMTFLTAEIPAIYKKWEDKKQ